MHTTASGAEARQQRQLLLTAVEASASVPVMSRIHFVGGEKGGVGKSVLARVLSQWAIDRGLAVAGVDADESQGVLLRAYGEYTQGVDLSDVARADEILDRALGAERHVIVDLPARSARSLLSWFDSADVLSYAAELGVAISYWHVSDGGFASTAEIGGLLDGLGDKAQHVVVRNAGCSNDFSQLDASPTLAKLAELGGNVIDLPELDPAIMYKIDGSGCSFWAAAHSEQGEAALRLLERRRVKIWLERCYGQLALAPNASGA